MWSETSCGYLCIQVWGQTMLIGTGADSVLLCSLCMYPKGTGIYIWEVQFYNSSNAYSVGWPAVLSVPQVWTFLIFMYFRHKSRSDCDLVLKTRRGTLQEMMRSNDKNKIPPKDVISIRPGEHCGVMVLVSLCSSKCLSLCQPSPI